MGEPGRRDRGRRAFRCSGLEHDASEPSSLLCSKTQAFNASPRCWASRLAFPFQMPAIFQCWSLAPGPEALAAQLVANHLPPEVQDVHRQERSNPKLDPPGQSARGQDDRRRGDLAKGADRQLQTRSTYLDVVDLDGVLTWRQGQRGRLPSVEAMAPCAPLAGHRHKEPVSDRNTGVAASGGHLAGFGRHRGWTWPIIMASTLNSCMSEGDCRHR